MNTPKISVIVPCYGVEKYLDRCMNSIVNQTLKDIEIIMVDDGSPDSVPEMCDDWAKKDNRIKVIHKMNGGLGFARNSGLEIATGEYIAFIDSDDYLDVTMFEHLYNEGKEVNADVVFCNFYKETPSGNWQKMNAVNERTLFSGKPLQNMVLDMIASGPGVAKEKKYPMCVWHGIYQKTLIMNNHSRFESERQVGSEDIMFNVPLLLNSEKIVYVPECYYYYCLNAASLSSRFMEESYGRVRLLHHKLHVIVKPYGNDAIFRVNRFFIGLVRGHISQLVSSNNKYKLRIINEIIKDEVWNNLKQEVLPSQLPLYASIAYRLILLKLPITLCCYSKLLNLYHKIR